MSRTIGVIFIFLLLPALLHLFIFVKTLDLGYQIDQQKAQLRKLTSENRQLSCSVSNYGGLARIDNLAQKKLGMVHPEKINYVYVTPEAVADN